MQNQTMKYIIILILSAVYLTAEDKGVPAPANWARSVVTAVIIGESGGHGLKGCEAVYEVIHSRASRRRSTCLYEVLKPMQFSCLNKPTTSASLVRKHREHPMWDKVFAFVGERPQYKHTGTKWSNACTHYHAEYQHKLKLDKKTGKKVKVKVKFTPWWVKDEKPVATFGGHKWYNNVK